jgi:hypothetical protein
MNWWRVIGCAIGVLDGYMREISRQQGAGQPLAAHVDCDFASHMTALSRGTGNPIEVLTPQKAVFKVCFNGEPYYFCLHLMGKLS